MQMAVSIALKVIGFLLLVYALYATVLFVLMLGAPVPEAAPAAVDPRTFNSAEDFNRALSESQSQNMASGMAMLFKGFIGEILGFRAAIAWFLSLACLGLGMLLEVAITIEMNTRIAWHHLARQNPLQP